METLVLADATLFSSIGKGSELVHRPMGSPEDRRDRLPEHRRWVDQSLRW